jgi:ABC-type uncharacterized transport system permease subunit
MSSTVTAPQEIALVITGILLLFSACGAWIRWRAGQELEKTTVRKAEDEERT